MYHHGEYKPKDIYTRYGRLLVYLTWFLIHSFFWFVFFVYCILVMIRCIFCVCVWSLYGDNPFSLFFYFFLGMNSRPTRCIFNNLHYKQWTQFIWFMWNGKNKWINEWWAINERTGKNEQKKRKRLVHEKHSTKQQQQKNRCTHHHWTCCTDWIDMI